MATGQLGNWWTGDWEQAKIDYLNQKAESENRNRKRCGDVTTKISETRNFEAAARAQNFFLGPDFLPEFFFSSNGITYQKAAKK